PAQSDVDDFDASGDQSVRERVQQRFAGMPHVATERDPLGLEALCIGDAQSISDVRIELVGYAATDVVGLEAGKRHGDLVLFWNDNSDSSYPTKFTQALSLRGRFEQTSPRWPRRSPRRNAVNPARPGREQR